MFAAAVDLGINRLRVGLSANLESPVDYFPKFVEAFKNKPRGERPQWETINDDDDPNHINPSGFQFSSLDFKIEGEVLPLKELLKARGEELFIDICFVDFSNNLTDIHA